MAKPPTPDDLYRLGRSYPTTQPHDRRHPAPPRADTFHRHEEVQGNQAPEDQHDNRGGYYDNEVPANSWLRSDGTKKPSFDKSNAWRAGRAGVDHGQGDPATIRKPVGEK